MTFEVIIIKFNLIIINNSVFKKTNITSLKKQILLILVNFIYYVISHK